MKIKEILSRVLSVFIVGVVSLSMTAYANSGTLPSTDGAARIENPAAADSITGFITLAVSKVAEVGLVLLVLAVIYVGFKYVMARGNPKSLEEAHRALLYTFVGGLILIGAELFAKIISATVTGLSK